MRHSHLPAVFAAATLLACASQALAAPSFTLGNNPEPDEQNVLFGTSQVGMAITGTTNQTNTEVLVTSTQVLQTGGVGQAYLEPVSGVFTNFAVTLPGNVFRDIIFNTQIGGQPKADGGTATLTVVGSDGTFDFSYDLGNGQNYLTIVAAAGETMTSVAFSVTDGFNQLQQIRISGLTTPTGVPEPVSMALFGLGLAGLGLVRRKA